MPDATHCPECGADLPARTHGGGKPKQYCGDVCRSRYARRNQGTHARCAYCDGPFIANVNRQKYCSGSCSNRATAPAPRTELLWADCRMCATTWLRRAGEGRTYCSEECRRHEARIKSAHRDAEDDRSRTTPRQFPCAHCGSVVTVAYADKRRSYCSDRCARSVGNLAGKARRRMRQDTTRIEPVYRRKVYERDGWRCQLCKRKVSKIRSYPDPLSPSLDHVIPLADGGAHTMANVQLAHLRCNLLKGTRPQGEQLRLIG